MFSRTFSTTALVATLLTSAHAASPYTLADAYTSSNFASSWNFYDQADPTHGFVNYLSSAIAQSSLLAGKTTTGNIYLGSTPAKSGAQSIRVSTQKTYQYHLLIADILHAPAGSGPGGSCGLWPALWELGGPTWPTDGEIDIYEGVNAQQANQMTLHTGPSCSVTKNATAFSGNMTSTDCNVSNGANGNAGCSVQAAGPSAASSFGAAFNAAGGGVLALEVSQDNGIRIWQFPRSAVPADISQGAQNPDPESWGLPSAAFAGACDVGEHFKNLSIVINTAYCGDWAGQVWSQPQANGQPSCAQMTGVQTCDAYVAANPNAFADAYWEIKAINVYTQGDDAAASPVDRRQQPELSGIFSQPTGVALTDCQELTPGHCGTGNDDAEANAADEMQPARALAIFASLTTVFVFLLAF